MIVTGLIFPWHPRSPEQRASAQPGEKVRFRRRADYVIGFTLPAQVHRVRPADEGHVLEGVVLSFPIEEIRAREGIISRRSFGLIQANQLTWLIVWKGAQKDGINDAKDCSICADAESQRNNGYRRK